MTKQEQDIELSAIQQVIEALTPLDSEARDRVVRYVFQRLSIAPPLSAVTPAAPSIISSHGPTPTPESPVSQTKVADIRSFKELKQPRSANEMTAIVAYYLAELAPAQERKPEISTAEIDKFFKHASFPLPAAPRMALSNAKNAGYLDTGADRGWYKLNPVGHNLVAHNLPSAEAERKPASAKKRTKKKVATRKKKANKKKPQKR